MTPELLFEYIMSAGGAILCLLFIAALMGFFDGDK